MGILLEKKKTLYQLPYQEIGSKNFCLMPIEEEEQVGEPDEAGVDKDNITADDASILGASPKNRALEYNQKNREIKYNYKAQKELHQSNEKVEKIRKDANDRSARATENAAADQKEGTFRQAAASEYDAKIKGEQALFQAWQDRNEVYKKSFLQHGDDFNQRTKERLIPAVKQEIIQDLQSENILPTVNYKPEKRALKDKNGNYRKIDPVTKEPIEEDDPDLQGFNAEYENILGIRVSPTGYKREREGDIYSEMIYYRFKKTGYLGEGNGYAMFTLGELSQNDYEILTREDNGLGAATYKDKDGNIVPNQEVFCEVDLIGGGFELGGKMEGKKLSNFFQQADNAYSTYFNGSMGDVGIKVFSALRGLKCQFEWINDYSIREISEILASANEIGFMMTLFRLALVFFQTKLCGNEEGKTPPDNMTQLLGMLDEDDKKLLTDLMAMANPTSEDLLKMRESLLMQATNPQEIETADKLYKQMENAVRSKNTSKAFAIDTLFSVLGDGILSDTDKAKLNLALTSENLKASDLIRSVTKTLVLKDGTFDATKLMALGNIIEADLTSVGDKSYVSMYKAVIDRAKELYTSH